MATRIVSRSANIPPSSDWLDPPVHDLSFPPGEVEWVDIIVPGNTPTNCGIGLAQAGNLVYPSPSSPINVDDFLRGHNDPNSIVHRWPLERTINSGDWQALGFNQNLAAVTFYFIFGVVDREPAGGEGLGLGFEPVEVGPIEFPPLEELLPLEELSPEDLEEFGGGPMELEPIPGGPPPEGEGFQGPFPEPEPGR